MKVNTSINIAGVEFINPVMAASGTFGFGREYADYMDLNKIGGISVKGLTLKPRLGNNSRNPIRNTEQCGTSESGG